jgi:hypothetical protein
MTHVQIQPGYRFRLRRDIDRFPDFLVREGATGTVTEVTEDGVIVALMDRHIHGAEEWDNHVWWDSGFLDDTLPLNL